MRALPTMRVVQVVPAVRTPHREPGGTRVPGATHEADGPAGEEGAPVDAGSPDVGSAPLVAATASVDASSHNAAMAPTTGVGPGRTSPVSITSAATSLDNGKPLSLPAPAPGFGIASGPSGSRGAVPAAENPPGAAAPRWTGPGTTASAATGGIAPPAVAVAVETELGGDATELMGATGAADVSLDTAGLATSISGALSRGSGSYNVVLNLHPPELGQVQATLSLRGDQLQVDLSPEHAAGHDALESALPALREHLAQGGVEVDVTLGDPGTAHQGAPAGGSTGQSSQRGEADTDESDGSIAAASASAAAGPSPARPTACTSCCDHQLRPKGHHMTMPVSGVSGGTAGADDSTQSSSVADGTAGLLDPSTFLTLLVDELKYQNPLDPTSASDFMGQIASLSQVEQLQSVSTAEQMGEATGLIGETVTADSGDGTLTGEVTGVTNGSSGPLLDVGNTTIDLDAVQQITNS